MSQLLRKGRNFFVRVHVNGRPRDIATRTSDRRQAEIMKARIDLAHRRASPFADTRTPLEPALAEFCAHLAHDRRPKPLLNDLSRLRMLFGPRVDALAPRRRGRVAKGYAPPLASVALVEGLTAPVILRALDHVCTVREIGGKTRSQYREILGRFLGYCAERFSVRFDEPGGPVSTIRPTRLRAPEIVFLQPDEIRAQLDALTQHPRIRAAVALMIFAGLRREEVFWLTVGDLDLKRGWLTVGAKADPVTGERWQPKTAKNRGVAVSSALMAELERYFDREGVPAHWLVPSPTGKRWEPSNFSTDLREANARAGLRWSCLHYRHTFGTACARMGLSYAEIASWMGNSEAVVRRHYVCSSALEARRHLLDFMPADSGAVRAQDRPPLRLVLPEDPKPETTETPDLTLRTGVVG